MAIILWLSCHFMPFYRRERRYEYRHHFHRPPFPGGESRDHRGGAAAGDQRPQDCGRAGLPVLWLRSGGGAAACKGRAGADGHRPQGGGPRPGPELPHLSDGRDAPVRQPLPVLLCGSDAAPHAAVPVHQGRRRAAQLPAGQLHHPDEPDGAARCWATRGRSGRWNTSGASARRASS